MANSKSCKYGILFFRSDWEGYSASKDVVLNVIEFIGGMGVPKDLPGGKKIGGYERFDVRVDSRERGAR